MSTTMSTVETKLESFMLGSVKVTPSEKGGYWLQYRLGRSRFVPPNSDTARKIESGYTLTKLDAAQRVMATGTHEKVIYFRNAEGKIGIPPDPLLIPDDCERFEANSLRQLDQLSEEMSRDHYDQFQDNGAWQEGMDEFMGSPRKYLVDRLAGSGLSNFNRDLIHELIKEGDKEAADRQRITTSSRFRVRDWDR